MGDESFAGGELLAGDAAQQLAEWLAQRKNFPEIGGGEIRTRDCRARTLPADLNDANYFPFGENGSAEHFLDGFPLFGPDFHSFKDCRVPCHGEIVVNFGPAIARGPSGEGRIAGEGNESDVFQGFGHEKMEMAPAGRNAHDGDFIFSYGERL